MLLFFTIECDKRNKESTYCHRDPSVFFLKDYRSVEQEIFSAKITLKRFSIICILTDHLSLLSINESMMYIIVLEASKQFLDLFIG